MNDGFGPFEWRGGLVVGCDEPVADSDEENHSFRAEENYFIAQRRR